MTVVDTPDKASAVAASAEHEYRPLIDRLVILAEHLPVSAFVAGQSAVGKLVAALAHYAEHGEDILDAADEAAHQVAKQLRLPADQRSAAIQVHEVVASGFPNTEVNTQAADRDRLSALEAELAQMRADNDRERADRERLQAELDAQASPDEQALRQQIQAEQSRRISDAASARTEVSVTPGESDPDIAPHADSPDPVGEPDAAPGVPSTTEPIGNEPAGPNDPNNS